MNTIHRITSGLADTSKKEMKRTRMIATAAASNKRRKENDEINYQMQM